MRSAGEPPPAAGPAVAETHISTVFFSADRAFKLLKPVETSFLDLSTAERRLQAIDDELRLNRRLAPDVYLGTADVVERGEVVDRLLVMRRLPAERRLSTLAASGADVSDCLRSVARQVAAFHAAQSPAPDGAEVASRDAVAANWAGNFGDLRALRGTVIEAAEYDRVEHLAHRFLDHRAALLEARIDGGLVRDGHGDLTAQDVFCLDDGPRILDCLAFDRRLRVADVLADVAFLAMDLDRLAGTPALDQFLRFYAEFSNEHHPPALAHHYVAYRAHVRAKVAAIRFHQSARRHGYPDGGAGAGGGTGAGGLGAGPVVADQAHEVVEYHRLCLRHLEQARIRLILVGGTPGSGKSTLANALADHFQALVLGTDELRKELAGLVRTERDLSPVDGGIYGADSTEATYRALLERAGKVLDRGRSVILDASWRDAGHRQLARRLAESKGADLLELECQVDAETARLRLIERAVVGLDASDARPELLAELRRRHQPWPEAIPIDTTAPVARVVADAVAAISAADEADAAEGANRAGAAGKSGVADDASGAGADARGADDPAGER